MAPSCLTAFALVVATGLPASAAAQGQTADDNPASFALRSSFKSSLLMARLPDDPALFPDRATATGFWRVRVEPTVRWGEPLAFEAAFEQRLRVFSSESAAAGARVLPSEADAPFRIRQLDWRFASASHAEWRGEIDRAALHVHGSGADITVGRQAIGWGRGALFGAVDLFAPFTPLEADREWRRGVDAVRADVKLGDRVSLDTAAAFGDTLRRSTFATRLRGYAGKADLEVLGGYRARDLFAGLTSSAAVGEFELHGEVALFRSDAVAGSREFGRRRSIVKAVIGGSYRLPIGSGVLTYGEYHYSGFGATSPDQIVRDLGDATFLQRYLRGDMQILGRHAVAVLASYEVAPELAVSYQWLQSPVDGSGVVVPSMTWTLSDRWSALVTGYVPYGRRPSGMELRSLFGASPLAAFVQVRAYR